MKGDRLTMNQERLPECEGCNGDITLLYDGKPICSRCAFKKYQELGDAWDKFFNELAKGLKLEEIVEYFEGWINKWLRRKTD